MDKYAQVTDIRPIQIDRDEYTKYMTQQTNNPKLTEMNRYNMT